MEFRQITHQKYNGGLFIDTKTNMLTWNAGLAANDFIIIKAPSTTNIDLSNPEFQNILSGVEKELIRTRQVQINQIEVSLLSNSDFIKANKKYAVTGGNYQYWVFAADVTDSVVCYIYDKNDKVIQNKVKVTSQVNVLCEKVTQSTGSFFKKLFSGGTRTYRRITVDTKSIYHDGNIYYVINDFKYPVTHSMVNTKSPFCIDIPHETKISFVADDDSIKINVTETEKEVN